MTNEKIVVIGFGSLNGDDQAGWRVIDYLQGRVSEGFILFQSKADGTDWFPIVEGAAKVFFVDAVKSDKKIGFVHVFDDLSSCLNTHTSSSHAINIFESIELAKSLGYLKKEFKFFGIEIGNGNGNDSTEAVSQSVKQVANLIKSLV